jgi:hypothetical protein
VLVRGLGRLGRPRTKRQRRAGRLVVAAGIHVPFAIAAGVIVLGIVILSTAYSLLGEAERVQAQQVTAEGGRAVGRPVYRGWTRQPGASKGRP